MSKKIKIGDKFTHVRVKIDSLMNKIEVRQERLNVIGVSYCLVCLDDPTFSTLAIDKTFKFCHAEPEKVGISESSNRLDIDLFGKFNISFYSQMSDKKIESKLNREFKKWLDEKLGSYGMAKTIEIKLDVKEE